MRGSGPVRRVVVTGLGAITPLGLTVESFWDGCVNGRSGVTRITKFDASAYPTQINAEVKGFDPLDYIDRKEARRMARFTQLAVAAARQAIEAAALDLEKEDRSRIGAVLGNGNGGFPNTEEAMRTLVEKGGMRMDPFYIPKMLPNMAAAQVAIQFGLKGYNNTAITACAASTQAIGEALEVVRRGKADVMVTGGTEAGISELGLASFCVMRALSTRNDEPEKASRPFDAERDGFVCAEGAAILVLESLEHAQKRGAPILAELAGYGASADAFHIVAPCEDGDGALRAMRWALEDAGVTPAEVSYINAHGTSTPLNDAAETRAIKALFGEQAYKVPISSTKSMIGHVLGGAGALESVACVQTLLSQTIHPTINREHPDPECDLDYVPEGARKADVRVILKNSFGFGGQNACLVFRKFEG
ncbi:MAG: beta-ketoacyl-ACP synthase II [Dehalococcoidia bacterium]|nr:beta-ketoacyl-ACP synthase II [Dehalococcoidia bacterium]